MESLLSKLRRNRFTLLPRFKYLGSFLYDTFNIKYKQKQEG